ncbi:MAG: RNA polymerase sigma-54 factor, partial [Planctomycetota bacterium]
YAQTPFGVLPLRRFFQSAAGGSPEQGRDGLKQAVADLFAKEDRSKPLSDDEAAAALRERGYDVARRTVANFRKELEIPSSYRRRRFD